MRSSPPRAPGSQSARRRDRRREPYRARRRPRPAPESPPRLPARRPHVPATPRRPGRDQRAASSSSSHPRLARTEETKQRLDDPAIGADRDLVDREPAQEMPSLLTILVRPPLELRAHSGIAGVDAERVPRLGVDEPDDAEVGKMLLARILHAHGDE